MRISIIDDDPISCHLTEYMLKARGISGEITSYLNAEEACHTLLTMEASELPAIIFLDLNMPQMNGWQFLDSLTPHENRLKEKCRIYILTSSLDVADSDRSRDYDLVRGFIHKPLEYDDIDFVLADPEDQ